MNQRERDAAYAARCCDWHFGDDSGCGDRAQPCRGAQWPGRAARDPDAQLYRMPAIERYQRDPEFNRLVDMMQAMIHQAQFSPSELREAAVLAATMYEERRNIPRYGLARAPKSEPST
jgi:hypothetical protein